MLPPDRPLAADAFLPVRRAAWRPRRGVRGLAAGTIGIVMTAISAAPAEETSAEAYAAQRNEMVQRAVVAAGIAQPGVLEALRGTPRHEFVPAGFRRHAYDDVALPIGDGQTISPPYVVAYMTQAIDPQPGDRVLEIGTGSGYQAAVLSGLAGEVFTIEIVERLARRAARTLSRLGYANVHVRSGDGFQGWPEAAPFDKIIVTCSPENVPPPLVQQLEQGGSLVIPVGERYRQNLVRLTKRGAELVREDLQATLFVPMTGLAEQGRQTLPDPAAPTLFNGGFEEVVANSSQPLGWHYLRQAQAVEDAAAPQGRRVLRLENAEAGLPCQALQGLAVDGRRIARLELALRVRGTQLAPGSDPEQQAAVVVTFYDERRAAIGQGLSGPWSGSFDWRPESKRIDVPLAAREAIVRIGLHGGRGRLEIDEAVLRPASP